MKKRSKEVQKLLDQITSSTMPVSTQERALYAQFGTTPETIEQQMHDEGYDVARLIQQVRSIGDKVRSQHEGASLAPLLQKTLQKPLPHFEEYATAGTATPATNERAQMESMQKILGSVPLDEVILVNIAGDSMTKIGLMDKDVVLVQVKQEPKSGDIVLAQIEGQGQVVKRLELHEDKALLISENDNYAPIEISNPEQLRIVGVVWGRIGKI